MSIVMGMQNFIKVYQKVQEIGPVSLFFSEFEPRQNLDQSQITFDNLIGYILSISMCMQNFITISFSSKNRAIFTFSEFGARQSLDRYKISVRNLLGYILSISIFTQKNYQNIPLSSRDSANFTFFRIWHSAKPPPMINVFL